MAEHKPMNKDRSQSKEAVIAAIQEVARQVGHVPTAREFRPLGRVSLWQVTGRFGTYRNALRAAGLEPSQRGVKVEAAALLEDWGKAVRKLGLVPSQRQYRKAGIYSCECFFLRFKRWVNVPAEFTRFVKAGWLAGDWTDVGETIRRCPIPQQGAFGMLSFHRAARAAYEGQIRQTAAAKEALTRGASRNLPWADGMLSQPGIDLAIADLPIADLERRPYAEIAACATLLPPPLRGKKCVTATMLAVFVAERAPSAFPWVTGACFARRPLPDRPMLGPPIRPCGLAYEPVNEMGVMALFCMLSRQLGFVIESVQSGFPDCEAKIEVEPGRWQHFRIEFEYESRNFRDHRHDPEKCDLIVCWRHNWKDCPPNLQVLELSKVMGQLW
jgi:Homing endonuclease associated repeat